MRHTGFWGLCLPPERIAWEGVFSKRCCMQKILSQLEEGGFGERGEERELIQQDNIT